MTDYEKVLSVMTDNYQKTTAIADSAGLTVNQTVDVLREMIKNDVVVFKKEEREASLRYALKKQGVV